jgi:hypothetical protein
MNLSIYNDLSMPRALSLTSLLGTAEWRQAKPLDVVYFSAN